MVFNIVSWYFYYMKARLLKMAILLGVYLLTAKLGLAIVAESGFAALVWRPTGIAFAALFLNGIRLWPAATREALIVNFWTGVRQYIRGD